LATPKDNKNMFRNAILSAVLVAGFAGTALAADPIKVLGTGENFAVEYSNDGGNILGGGPVQVIGNGEGAIYRHAEDAPAQAALIPRVVGNGESARIIYTPVPMTEDLSSRG
jgi:hypothetical protein